MGRGDEPDRVAARPFATADALDDIRKRVQAEAGRVARLGEWPDFIDPQEALTGRVPQPGGHVARGFDAGVACCLDLIPRDKQRLAALLHAHYTPDAVAQVLREADEMDPDSETAWWLAACSVCREGDLDAGEFIGQLGEFQRLAGDPRARRAAAIDELAEMRSRYEMRDGVPFTTADGGMQGAYLDGHRFAVEYASHADLYFIGTYEPSLGLEDFSWSDEVDEHGRPRSGGVHGSHQFAKAADRDEFERAIAVVRRHLGAG